MSHATAHWLVKTEPEEFGWRDLAKTRSSCWDGVRNAEARNNLRAMGKDDSVLVYHSGKARAVVGLARVVRTAYADPTATRPIWVAVDLAPVRELAHPVSLALLKSRAEFADCALVRRPRLSVIPISPEHFARILELSEAA